MGRILLAEDNEVSQEVAVELLRRAGHHCQAVSTGQQAVEEALKGEYDLILMDCQMPEMDGFEATRAIRKHEREAGLCPAGRPTADHRADRQCDQATGSVPRSRHG